MKVEIAFCALRSSVISERARGVADWAAACRAENIVATEKIATAGMLDARIVSVFSTASRVIHAAQGRGTIPPSSGAMARMATALSAERAGRNQIERRTCRQRSFTTAECPQGGVGGATLRRSVSSGGA